MTSGIKKGTTKNKSETSLPCQSPSENREIKKMEFLPKWFSMKNYPDIDKWSFEKWVDLLRIRQRLFLSYQSYDRDMLASMGETPEQVFGRSTKYPEPVFDDSNFRDRFHIDEECNEGNSDSSNKPLPQNNAEISTVQSLTLDEVNRLFLWLYMSIDNGIVKQKTSFDAKELAMYEKYTYDKLVRDTGYSAGFKVHAVIDMAAPDSKIHDDIQIWLGTQRKLAKITSVKDSDFGENKANKWAKWKLLPAMDLYIWSRIENVVISDSLMAEVVFKDIYKANVRDNRDVIRKSCTPEIERILTPQYQEIFMNLAQPAKEEPKRSSLQR